jgi:nitrous oxide reductase accessory protein NosL
MKKVLLIIFVMTVLIAGCNYSPECKPNQNNTPIVAHMIENENNCTFYFENWTEMDREKAKQYFNPEYIEEYCKQE